MTYQPEAIRIADGLDQNVQIDPQTSEDEPGGYRSELDELMADAAAILRSQHARIAKLEAMLDAVGAGGVGQSIRPAVQADTAQEPVAWRVRPFDYGIGHEGVDALTTRKEQCEMWERKGWKVEPLYTAPQPTENLSCKSTQKRLATLWGYVKKEPDHFRDATQMVPARQPLTNEQIIAIADNARAAESGDAGYILPIAFARAIEAALSITGGQQ